MKKKEIWDKDVLMTGAKKHPTLLALLKIGEPPCFSIWVGWLF